MNFASMSGNYWVMIHQVRSDEFGRVIAPLGHCNCIMHAYAGMFAIAFATLALEVIFSRLLSVITWYHLVFFAVSTAMLGMTAGATRVYLQPHRYREDQLDRRLSGNCLGFAISVPVSLSLLCLLPLELQPFVTSYVAFLFATVACALPFYFSGVVVTVMLTKYPLPIGRLYACDLVGASLGCLFVLGGLEVFDAPSLILLCSSFGILASLCFAAKNTSRAAAWVKIILLVATILASFANAFSHYGLRPLFVKGRIVRPASYLLERWNSFSRVMVYKGGESWPHYWGPSPKAPTHLIHQFYMNIDGEAATPMRKFANWEDIEHLRYDVTNIGYFLGREGPACIIGVGGGRDVQSALLFGQKPVVGIEVNAIFIDLLRGAFADFAGLARRDDVELVIDDARSYLSRTRDRFSVIQMSMIDTWAATGAGAFSLTENALYTVQAWKVFLGRLAEGGVFTVSRWHSPRNLGESGRAVSLAVATLLELGVEDPSRHIAMITTDRISTLLLSLQPFGSRDVDVLRSRCDEMGYRTVHLPGALPDHDDLKELLGATSMPELLAASRGKVLNYEPPTDESPYFFNMLKLASIGLVQEQGQGVVKGNLYATWTLLVLLLSLLAGHFGHHRGSPVDPVPRRPLAQGTPPRVRGRSALLLTDRRRLHAGGDRSDSEAVGLSGPPSLRAGDHPLHPYAEHGAGKLPERIVVPGAQGSDPMHSPGDCARHHLAALPRRRVAGEDDYVFHGRQDRRLDRSAVSHGHRVGMPFTPGDAHGESVTLGGDTLVLGAERDHGRALFRPGGVRVHLRGHLLQFLPFRALLPGLPVLRWDLAESLCRGDGDGGDLNDDGAAAPKQAQIALPAGPIPTDEASTAASDRPYF